MLKTSIELDVVLNTLIGRVLHHDVVSGVGEIGGVAIGVGLAGHTELAHGEVLVIAVGNIPVIGHAAAHVSVQSFADEHGLAVLIVPAGEDHIGIIVNRIGGLGTGLALADITDDIVAVLRINIDRVLTRKEGVDLQICPDRLIEIETFSVQLPLDKGISGFFGSTAGSRDRAAGESAIRRIQSIVSQKK